MWCEKLFHRRENFHDSKMEENRSAKRYIRTNQREYKRRRRSSSSTLTFADGSGSSLTGPDRSIEEGIRSVRKDQYWSVVDRRSQRILLMEMQVIPTKIELDMQICFLANPLHQVPSPFSAWSNFIQSCVGSSFFRFNIRHSRIFGSRSRR